jgi:hypothetical protein
VLADRNRIKGTDLLFGVFRAQPEAAKKELAAVQEKGLKPSMDCTVEAAALGF